MSRKSIVGLLEKIVTSTSNTVRAVLAALAIIGAIVGGLWLLHADLTAGPISVTGRETSKTEPPGTQTTLPKGLQP